MTKDATQIIKTLTLFESQENGAGIVRALSTIAILLGELTNRPTKATYHRKFNFGKLEIDVNFYGMR